MICALNMVKNGEQERSGLIDDEGSISSDGRIDAAIKTAKLYSRLKSALSDELRSFLKSSYEEIGQKGDKKEYIRRERTLLSDLSWRVMELIWRNSDFVDGDKRTFEKQELSKSSIAKILLMNEFDSKEYDSFRLAVSRAVDTLEYFELVYIFRRRSNYIHIECTKKLHEMLVNVSLRMSKVIAETD